MDERRVGRGLRGGRVWTAAALLLGMAAVQAQPAGEALYLQHCAVCHQPDGRGAPGFFPPLAGNAHVTGDDPAQVQAYLGRIVFGYHGGLVVDKRVYSGQMPPIGYTGRLNDSELLDLVNYLRSAWGNDARPITFEELAKARAAGRR